MAELRTYEPPKRKTLQEDLNDLVALPGRAWTGIQGVGTRMADWVTDIGMPSSTDDWLRFGDRTIGGIGFGGDQPITQPPPDDDTHSAAWNFINQFPTYWTQTAPQTLGHGLRDKWDEYVVKPIWDTFTMPLGEVKKQEEAARNPPEVTGQPVVSPFERYPVPGIDSSGPQATEIPGGSVYIPNAPPKLEPFQLPTPPEIAPIKFPDAPVQKPFDYGPMLEKLDEFRPEDLDRRQYMKDRILANLSRAFAAGAGGSGHSGAAGAFARFGAGFGTAQADTTERFLGEQKDIDEAQRLFGLKRLELETQGQKEAADIAFGNESRQYEVTTRNIAEENRAAQANADRKWDVLTKNEMSIHETNQQNADRMWDYENQKGKLLETTVTPGKDGKSLVIEEVNPKNGQRTYKFVNFNDPTYGGIYTEDQLDWLKKMKDNGMETTGAYKAVKYLPLLQSGDMIAVKRGIIEEAITGNQLDSLQQLGLLDEGAFQTAMETAQAEAMKISPDVSSDAYQEAFQNVLSATLMQTVKLEDWNVIGELAKQGNYGAGLLIKRYLQRQQAEAAAMPPAGSGIGPR